MAAGREMSIGEGLLRLSQEVHENIDAFREALHRSLATDLNLRDVDGRSALHWAVERGHLNIVRELLERGKLDLIDVQDEQKNTALHIAVKNDNLELAKLLVNIGARLDIINHEGETPMAIAQKGRLGDIIILLDLVDKLNKESTPRGRNIRILFGLTNMALSSLTETSTLPAVFIIGKTGHGKSTVVNYLSGIDFSEAYLNGQPVLIPTGSSRGSAMVGHDSDSQTLFVKAHLSKDRAMRYYDCPGFEDTRKDRCKEIEFFIQSQVRFALNRVSSVKGVIVVVNTQDLLASRETAFLHILESLSKILKQNNERGIFFAFNKSPKNYTKELLGKKLAQVLKAYQEKLNGLLNITMGDEEIRELTPQEHGNVERTFQDLDPTEKEQVRQLGDCISILRYMQRHFDNQVGLIDPTDRGATRESWIQVLNKTRNMAKNRFAFGERDADHNDFGDMLFKVAGILDAPLQEIERLTAKQADDVSGLRILEAQLEDCKKSLEEFQKAKKESCLHDIEESESKIKELQDDIAQIKAELKELDVDTREILEEGVKPLPGSFWDREAVVISYRGPASIREVKIAGDCLEETTPDYRGLVGKSSFDLTVHGLRSHLQPWLWHRGPSTITYEIWVDKNQREENKKLIQEKKESIAAKTAEVQLMKEKVAALKKELEKGRWTDEEKNTAEQRLVREIGEKALDMQRDAQLLSDNQEKLAVYQPYLQTLDHLMQLHFSEEEVRPYYPRIYTQFSARSDASRHAELADVPMVAAAGGAAHTPRERRYMARRHHDVPASAPAFDLFRGYVVQRVDGDGNCFFHALADQLNQKNIPDAEGHAYTHETLRMIAYTHVLEHEGLRGFFTNEDLIDLSQLKGWVGHETIQALADLMGLEFQLMRNDGQPDVSVRPVGDAPAGPVIRLLYNGVHYDSLREASADFSAADASMTAGGGGSAAPAVALVFGGEDVATDPRTRGQKRKAEKERDASPK